MSAQATGHNVDRVDTTQEHPLGTRHVTKDGFIYEYVRADDAVAANDFVAYDYAAGGSGAAADVPHLVTPVSAVTNGIAGHAAVAIAAGSYGWIMIEGVNASGNIANGAAADDALGATATSGRLATVTVSATPAQAEVRAVRDASKIRRVVATAAPSGNVGAFRIYA